jgi:hypothetical protein
MIPTVHIVSFNVPYPPDYGGVIDVFYKIKALKQLGVEVILHCFCYGRPPSKTLEENCRKVYYYRRNLNVFLLLKSTPFIVLSRKNPELLKNLCKDDYPIILEGLHCTAYLGDDLLKDRFLMVRTHNIEHLYYRQLAEVEKNIFRKIFFRNESGKLEKYEAILEKADLLLTISPGDDSYFGKRFSNSLFIGPFHPSNDCTSLTGKGNFILMHGDFSTPENNASALYLLRNVISKWDYHTVIAGKRPSKEVWEEAGKHRNIKIVPNPSEKKMSDLIMNAHICLLHSFQPTGMKLKLINSLCSGRHIISSPAVTSGTGLDQLCHNATVPGEWISIADELIDQPFTEDEKSKRTPILKDLVDNKLNATKIIGQISKNNVHL